MSGMSLVESLVESRDKIDALLEKIGEGPTKKEEEDPLRAFGVFTLSFLGTGLTLVLYSYFLVDMWTWFLVPLGIQQVGYAHAYGFALVVKLLTKRYPTHKKDPKMELGTGQHLLAAAASSTLFWALGAFVHWMWM